MGVHRRGSDFVVRWLEGGKPPRGRYRQVTLRGVTHDQAEVVWKQKVGEAAGKFSAPGPRPTFGELVTRYLAVHGPELAPSWLKRVEGIFKHHVNPRFQTRTAEDLRPSDLIRYRNDRRAAGASPATVNRETTQVLAVLAFAVTEDWLPREPIPRRKVRPLPETSKETFFTPAEWHRLRTAFDDSARWEAHVRKIRTLGPVVVNFDTGVARRHGGGRIPEGEASHAYRARLRSAVDVLEAVLLTGSRIGEVLGLTWGSVDLRKGFIKIPQPKVGREKQLPISPGLRALLGRQRRGTGAAPVFQRPDGGAWEKAKVERAFRTARTLARLRPELRIHDLRHSAASWLTVAGVPERLVRDYLGHTAVSMTVRYSHVRPEALTEAAGIVSRLGATTHKAQGDTQGASSEGDAEGDAAGAKK